VLALRCSALKPGDYREFSANSVLKRCQRLEFSALKLGDDRELTFAEGDMRLKICQMLNVI
jgi:hypothetical protein